MAEATTTAHSGQVRSQRRAWTTSRGCWRLVVLLGLAWLALVLLGGTAQAAPSTDRDDRGAPVSPGPLPLVGRNLANVGTLTGALPVDEIARGLTGGLRPAAPAAPEPLAAGAETATAAIAGATDAAVQAVQAVEAATAEAPAGSAHATAEATASGQALLDLTVPALGSTVAPAVTAAAEQVDATAHLVVQTVLTAPLPLAPPLGGALAPVLGAIDLATDAVAATTAMAAGTVDGAVATTTRVIAPVLAVVSAPAGGVTLTAAGGAGTGTAAGAATQADLTTLAAGPGWVDAALTTPAPAGDSPLVDGTPGRPAVPPPDAGSSSDIVAQPASDIVTVLPAPVSGAGSTTGTGGAVPAPVLDQTLVRVEARPELVATTSDPIEGPVGPMPGTPCADPTFSPD